MEHKRMFVEDNMYTTSKPLKDTLEIYYKKRHLLTIYGVNVSLVFIEDEKNIEVK